MDGAEGDEIPADRRLTELEDSLYFGNLTAEAYTRPLYSST